MKVAVLGCGPAGLMAAHAATQQGADVDILSHRVQSVIGGAQYLHTNIPGITPMEPDGEVAYEKVGSGGVYAQKVYGDREMSTSWSKFDGLHDCWSLQLAYDKLRNEYWDGVSERIFTGASIAQLCTVYDLVFSTLPVPHLCCKPDEHEVMSAPITLERGHHLSRQEQAQYSHNVVLYNGVESDEWYRTSRIFGEGWTEYGGHRYGEGGSAIVGVKPLGTSCDCHVEFDNYFRLGRFGQWQRGVLTSDAYCRALDIVTEGSHVVH